MPVHPPIDTRRKRSTAPGRGAGPKSPPPPRPRRRSRLASVLRVFVAGGLAIGLSCLLLLAALVAISAQSLPSYADLKTKQRGQQIVVRGLDGAPLTTIGPAYGEWLAFDDIPDVMVASMVSVEDRRYWRHVGIDPLGIARAMKRNLELGRFAQGGSTITQQVVKNVFLTSERSFARKARELVLAPALEVRFSKEQILELYLNRVYFGGGAYGVDAASRRFFGHSARSLSLPEAAVIAGLVKAPTRFAPSSSPSQARARGDIVLAAMVETGRLTPAQAQQVDFRNLSFARQPRQTGMRYFTDWVLGQLDTLIEETDAPLDIATTLDPVLQNAAERAIRAETPKGVQGAMIAMAYDGAIRAMIGGVDYVNSTYNRATIAQRQPGSAFKLFVYLAALEYGLKPADVRTDAPVSYGSWSPVNSPRGFRGDVTLTTAFAQSINTVAVKVAQEVGFGAVSRMARRLGITSKVSTQPAMALGVSELTLYDLVAAYAVVARGGTSVQPYAIREIKTDAGDILYRAPAQIPNQLLDPDVAAEMTRMMIATVETGTGRAAKLDRQAAGKTGTTQSNRDGWFIGFTADLTAGVWMGRDDAKAAPGLSGGRAPARAWAAFMRAGHDGLAPAPLTSDVAAIVTEPDDDAYGLDPRADGFEPAPLPPEAQTSPAEPLSDAWLNEAVNSSNGVQQGTVPAEPSPR
jgi:penicillin-binding protein 1A